MAAQLTLTNGPAANGLCSWMWAANSSLPVPDSPMSSTRASERAASVACSTTRANELARAYHARPRAHEFPQALVFFPQARLFERVLESQQHLVATERLFEKIVRSGSSCLHGVGNRAVAGNHDHRRGHTRSA